VTFIVLIFPHDSPAQYPLPYYYQSVVSFHTSGGLSYSEGGAKSVVEQAVNRLKDKRVTSTVKEDVHVTVEKPPLLQRVWDGVVHTITGFRLFIKDVRLSTRYLVKSLRGQQLSRRERKLVSLLLLPYQVLLHFTVSENCC